jgi:hypothetical protein
MHFLLSCDCSAVSKASARSRTVRVSLVMCRYLQKVVAGPNYLLGHGCSSRICAWGRPDGIRDPGGHGFAAIVRTQRMNYAVVKGGEANSLRT